MMGATIMLHAAVYPYTYSVSAELKGREMYDQYDDNKSYTRDTHSEYADVKYSTGLLGTGEHTHMT